jgi:hypothetical protein
MCKRFICLVSFVLLLGHTLTGPARAELVGWWKLDEGSGNIAYDSSGNGNDGTLEGTPQWAEGKLGGAWQGNGTNAFIRVPHSDSLMINDAITVTCWIYHTAAPADMIICKSDGTGTGWQSNYAIRLDDQGPRRVNWRGRATVNQSLTSTALLPQNEWVHIACTFDISTSTNRIYINGILDSENISTQPLNPGSGDLYIGADQYPANTARWWFQGMLDDVRIYNEALLEGQIVTIMQGGGAVYPLASRPNPADGALYEDTWVSLSWKPGDFAVSQDVYLGDNFDDVNDGLGDTFRGNQISLYFVAGFPGYPYPDGLVPGTTYYWRIDEVNEAEPNSPWKGKVWSFTVPSKKAYTPVPADGAEFVGPDVKLRWTAGLGAKLHTVYFGEDHDTVANANGGLSQGETTYTPGPLKLAKTYYWRVDEFDAANTYRGDVWSFTTEGAVSGPNPANGAVDVKPTVLLGWDAGAVAASHDVYFGVDADAVRNATKSSPEYKANKALGEESYDPGKLSLNTAYYWRIDEVNGVNPDSPWIGNVWSFETGDFFVLDDFEQYDANDNQIWYAWHDGLGYGSPDSVPYFGGNGTGAAVGDETTGSFTEETIVHGGNQSMPLFYDNNKQGYAKYSQAELAMTAQKDWTEQGIAELSLWFRGNPESVGSFVEGPVGTYTITATGADIWNAADQFHYAFKTLTGPGSIVAKVLSVDNTDPWAKAGVMIRETLDAGSKFAAVYITPGNGCRFQARMDTGVNATSDTAVVTVEQTAITSPYWIKMERDVAGNFRGFYSADGSSWRAMTWNPQNISMSSNVYVGLAVTAHNAAATCEVKFSNITVTGTVGPQWTDQDVGIESNSVEPLYVAVYNSTGAPAVVYHDDSNASVTDTWTEWVIPLQAFADQGISLTNVDRIAIGLGTQGNMAVPGGSGKMYIDDIRLYQPSAAAE